MLTPSKMSGGQGQYYLELAREDYYLEGGEPPGYWLGEGAAHLGLSGQVDKEELRQLFRGYSPEGQPLVQNAGNPKRQAGWDLTFSPPKSVSVAWSQADRKQAKAFRDAQADAVKVAMNFLEREGSFTRRGKGGVVREHAKLICAAFEHGTSRAQDPQLHTHVLAMNVCVRQDGTTGTLTSPEFYQLQMTAGALYRAELAYGIEQRLGLSVQKQGNSFELSCVPKSLIQFFSKRRQEIERLLEEKGFSSARAAEVANLQTRGRKEIVSRDQLSRQWKEIGREQGWSTPQLREAIVRERAARREQKQSQRKEQKRSRWEEQKQSQRKEQKWTDHKEHETQRDQGPRKPGFFFGGMARAFGAAVSEATLRTALADALEDITTMESHFSRRDLIRKLAEHAPGKGLKSDDILAAADHYLKHHAIALDDSRYTTPEMLQLENDLLAIATRLTDPSVYLWSGQPHPSLRQHILGHGGNLNVEQREALWNITTGTELLCGVDGMAGTGKTTMLRAVREVFDINGTRIIGAALSGQAAQELAQGTGIKSSSIASLLFRIKLETEFVAKLASGYERHAQNLIRTAFNRPTWPKPKPVLNRGDMLVIDEAGMVGTRDMARLLSHCERCGARVVLIGDPDQLQPIQAGSPFAYFINKFPQVFTKLTEIVRQREMWQRNAVKDFAAGNAHRGLEEYAQRGFVEVCEDKDKAREALLKAWADNGGLKNPQDHFVLAGKRVDIAILNREIQSMRRKEGVLGKLHASNANATFYTGDRVMFTETNKLRGFRNGQRATVVRVLPGLILRIRRDDDNKLVNVPILTYRHLTLGYAATTHKAQGMTGKHLYILTDEFMQDKHLSYVQASRAQKSTRFFTTKDEAGPDLSMLGERMSRERRKLMATELEVRELARQRPEPPPPPPPPKLPEHHRQHRERARGY